MTPTGAGTLAASVVVAVSVAAAVWAGARAQRGDQRAWARRRLATRAGGPTIACTPWFRAAVEAIDIGVDPSHAWPVARVVMGALGLALAFSRPWAVVSVAGLVGLAWAAGPRLSRHRSAGAYRRDLPVAVDALVAELRTGSSLAQALERVADDASAVGSDLARVVSRHQRGSTVQGALDQWAATRPGLGVDLVVDAVALAGGSGGSLAQALQGVVATLLERQELQREVVALGAQARASTAVLVATPVVFAVLAGLADPAIGRLLVTTPLGWSCLLGGLALDGFGAWWMHRLTAAVR